MMLKMMKQMKGKGVLAGGKRRKLPKDYAVKCFTF